MIDTCTRSLLSSQGWPADAPWTVRATKLYLYYPQAWWIAGGYTNGSLYDDNLDDLATPIVAR